MSQIQETERLDLQYEITLSYFVLSYNEKGHAIEVPKTNEKVKFWKLQRRNIEHSKLAMKILSQEDAQTLGVIGLAQMFVKCCCVDENIAQDILGDAFACVEAFQSEAAEEDFKRFFGTWDFLTKVPAPKSAKKPSAKK